MEDYLLIQSLDSLWFFSNLLSSSQTNPNLESFPTKEEDPQKPMKPVLQTQQTESPKAEFDVAGIITIEEEELPNPAKKEERSRKKKRKSKRKILGELDTQLGFDCDCGDNWGLNYEKRSGGILRSRQHLVKMPPLSDGMAMKEHLKSWAYAVACTVR